MAEITAQAQSLRDWLITEGYTDLHFEVPVEAKDPTGSTLRGTVDLLAMGNSGVLIVDHKSGPTPDPAARFAGYLPQLRAYECALGQVFEDRPINGLAINWISEGRISRLTETNGGR